MCVTIYAQSFKQARLAQNVRAVRSERQREEAALQQERLALQFAVAQRMLVQVCVCVSVFLHVVSCVWSSGLTIVCVCARAGRHP